MKRFWKIRIPALFVLIGLCFALVLSVALDSDPPGQKAPPGPFSVVLYGDRADRWVPLNQGLRQACDELGWIGPAVVLAPPTGPEEQIRLLQREITGGAQGLIVAATDSEAVRAFLAEQATPRIPVVTVETGAGTDWPAIRADDERMGEELAVQMAAAGVTEATLLQTHLYRDSVRLRYDAFARRAQALGISLTQWRFSMPDTDLAQAIADSLLGQPARNLVAFSTEALECSIDALQGTPLPPALYGIGYSDQIIASLDQGLIDGLCCQNEYKIGYLALMQLAGAMGVSPPTDPTWVEFRYINRANMYDPDIQRLIFPIIQ
ncbi:MAG: substrate-binding domain-containing protein [Oscillospiraceae bacterium]|nr:substrate-binding domain-containing protein [Oscillospiraceae bacterium]